VSREPETFEERAVVAEYERELLEAMLMRFILSGADLESRMKKLVEDYQNYLKGDDLE
jgi:hypothetical protein